jgi:uncharacterized protein (DUF433 family)
MTATRSASPSRIVPADLATMVRPDPNRPGPDRWRLAEHDIAVWAIIQHIIAIGDLDDPLEASNAVIEEAARDYMIPATGIRAALAYYAGHRGAIDTRLAINAEAIATR